MYPMTRSKRMQSVQHLAHNREQDAVRKLGESQQYLAAQQTKLQELRAYRDEYAKAFESSGGAGLDAEVALTFIVMLIAFGGFHIAVRAWAPEATPYLLPLAALLTAIGVMTGNTSLRK